MKKKPNIFLFIVESFRKDIVTDHAVCPNLSMFAENNISFNNSFSSANATQISWFSIFYSRFPFYWKHINTSNWASGSPALQVLKKLGYKINVYTSARLGYYEMDEIIFGKNKKLIDEFHFFEHNHTVETYESDTLTMNRLCKDITKEENQEGRVHIIFLDSTHFHYSWPEEQSPFKPYVRTVNYVSLTCLKKNLKEIKNSYMNAVHYLDSLFGKFYQTLEEQKQFQDSIVVVTGDHGEEFFDHRNIFHASDLSTSQTSVPLLFKFGDNEKRPSKERIVSHTDIFPSILDHIAKNDFDFDGDSIFQEERLPFAISGKYNASRTPKEFFIHNGQYKLMASFEDPSKALSCDKLEIVGVRDKNDHVVNDQTDIMNIFVPAIEALFSEIEPPAGPLPKQKTKNLFRQL